MRRAIQLLCRSLSAAVMARAPSRERRATSSAPACLAPDPAATPEAVIQVYGARCSGWVKPAGARAYTIYEVIDWRLRGSGSAVAIRRRAPDARWGGNAPTVLASKRGDDADALIERIDRAAREYPYAGEYAAWPGPNSNTFTAYIARAVPELGLDLPPTAIGKDFLGGRLYAAAPSGGGFQLSLLGLLGVLASGVEGFEVNVLGLAFGIDPFSPALRLPLVGRFGAAPSNGSGIPAGITAGRS